MKNGKKPSVAQCKFISSFGLDSRNWLVVKDKPEEMIVISRNGTQSMNLPKSVL